MKVLFVVRSTLYTAKGGDTTQVTETALQLQQLGVEVDIRKTNEKIDYSIYDLYIFSISSVPPISWYISKDRASPL